MTSRKTDPYACRGGGLLFACFPVATVEPRQHPGAQWYRPTLRIRQQREAAAREELQPAIRRPSRADGLLAPGNALTA